MNNLYIEIGLCLAYSLLFVLLIRKIRFFQLQNIPHSWISGAFILKVLSGIILYLVYTYYYPERYNADIYKYFDDGNILYKALWENPYDFFRIMFSIDNESPYFHRYYGLMNNWYGIYPTNLYGDGHIMIRFNALVRIISFGYLPVHTIIMAFLSFTGLIAFYNLFSGSLADRKRLLFLCLFLFPSLLFWSSGVLKEGLIIFSGGMLLYNWNFILKGRFAWWRITVILFSLVVLRYSKFYLFAIFVPLLLAYTWVELTKGRRLILKYFIVILIAFLTGLSLRFFNPYNDIPEILSTKHNDFIRIANDQNAGSLFSNKQIGPSWKQLLSETVPGFFSTLLRPFPWEQSSLIALPAILENIIILLGISFCLLDFRKPPEPNQFMFCIMFILICFSLSGIIAPVSGALIRYKVPALPFLLFALMQIKAHKGVFR